MEVVGHLVRLDPDQRPLDPIRAAIELFALDLVEGVREALAQPRQQPLQVGPAAGHPVLPEPALRFVQAQRARLGKRRPPELSVDARLVQPVPRLVHCAEQGHRQVGLVVAGGEPNVAAPDRDREGMLGRVDPPRALGEVELRDHLRDQLALLVRGEFAGERVLGLPGAVVRRLPNERHQPLAQFGQHLSHLIGGHLRLVLVEQGVVRVGEPGEALEALGVALGEVDVLPKVREQHREVRALLGLDPGRLGDRARVRHLGLELRGNPGRLLPVPGDDADEVGVDRLTGRNVALLGSDLVDQPADLIVDEHLVAHAREGRQGLRPRLGAGRGHHRALVPGQQRGGPAQVMDRAESFAKFIDGGHRPECSGRLAPAMARAARPRPPPSRGPRASAGGSGPSSVAGPAWRA